MGPLGRAGLFFALAGALVAMSGAVMWTSAANGLDRQAWLFYHSRPRSLPKEWNDAYRALDSARSVLVAGGAVALIGLVLTLLNLNQSRRPASTALPIGVASAALLISVIAFAISTPRG